MKTDLTAEQKDFAIFLPAISSFYSGYIGKQQTDPNAVPPSRMPNGIPDMEMLNFFNKNEGLFQYKWGLYSAGHAKLNLAKEVPKEDMIRKRSSDTFLLADSGGYQIGKLRWPAKWNDPSCKRAEKYRSEVLEWLSNISEYSMTLDVPAWMIKNPNSAAVAGIATYQDSVEATKYNHEYFVKNASGKAKFLNVLQGSDHATADHWYGEMKEFNDPSKHENFFQGWAYGGIYTGDPHIAIRQLVIMIDEGYMEEGVHDWLHVLGTSKMEWAVLLTAIQRAVRRTHNKNFTVSFDCASPFLAAANGQIYYETIAPDYRQLTKQTKSGKWSYRMGPTIDDKNFSNDTRPFDQAVIASGLNPNYEGSPISAKLLVNDVCIYGPNDLNKIGKQGKTSWDSFTYTLLMTHNLWHHINAVQEANRRFDQGIIPKMLVDPLTGMTVVDAIDDIFNAKGLKKRLSLVDGYSKLWMGVAGNRGMGGRNVIQASRQFSSIFDMDQVHDVDKPKIIVPSATDRGLFNFGD